MRVCGVCFVFVILLSACTDNVSYLDIALQQAKHNKGELEKVLKYFKNDSLKYRAAYFLIENMPYHDYYEGKQLEKYLKYFDVYSDGKHKPQQIVDSLKKADGEFLSHSLIHKHDIENIDSALLVNNIEWAFKVWKEQPWGKNVSFNDFCEFVLPYRVGDEPLAEWREQLYNRYNPLLDSIRQLPQAEDPLFVARILMNEWQKKTFYWTTLFPEGPHLGPVATELKSGSCREFADAVVYILRAVGIPCGTDKMLVKGDNNASHFWAFILDKDRNTYTMEPNETWTKAQKAKVMTAKIHRSIFGINKKWLEESEDISGIHPTFRYARLQDVTSVYNDSSIYQVTIFADDMYSKINKGEWVYLCLASYNQWKPVDFALMQERKVCFKDVGAGTVCMLATWNGTTLQPQSDPFFVEKSIGKIRFYHPGSEKQNIDLHYKYYITGAYDFVDRMIGGIIEGSNRADFINADTLYLINKAPKRLMTTVYPKNSEPYRYIRYKGPTGSYSNIAELALYDNKEDLAALNGKIIGTPGCWDGDGSHEYTNVFDGDPYTSFNYKYADGGWTGLDLKIPYVIRKIVYAPRNRDNFIWKGDNYELFYWNRGKWESLGGQIAGSDILQYNVPKGSLLYLKNHTRGDAERIFEYVDGEQIFR